MDRTEHVPTALTGPSFSVSKCSYEIDPPTSYSIPKYVPLSETLPERQLHHTTRVLLLEGFLDLQGVFVLFHSLSQRLPPSFGRARYLR